MELQFSKRYNKFYIGNNKNKEIIKKENKIIIKNMLINELYFKSYKIIIIDLNNNEKNIYYNDNKQDIIIKNSYIKNIDITDYNITSAKEFKTNFIIKNSFIEKEILINKIDFYYFDDDDYYDYRNNIKINNNLDFYVNKYDCNEYNIKLYNIINIKNTMINKLYIKNLYNNRRILYKSIHLKDSLINELILNCPIENFDIKNNKINDLELKYDYGYYENKDKNNQQKYINIINNNINSIILNNYEKEGYNNIISKNNIKYYSYFNWSNNNNFNLCENIFNIKELLNNKKIIIKKENEYKISKENYNKYKRIQINNYLFLYNTFEVILIIGDK